MKTRTQLNVRKPGGHWLAALFALLLLASCTQKTTVIIPDSNTGGPDTTTQKHIIRSEKK